VLGFDIGVGALGSIASELRGAGHLATQESVAEGCRITPLAEGFLEATAVWSAGRNLHNGREVPGRAVFDVASGDRLRIETPGGCYGVRAAASLDNASRTASASAQLFV
jgi:hypothetical protein